MKISEILLQDYDIEISNTRRTLERVPEGKNDWKCHDKSMALGKLAMHCATLPLFGHYVLEDDGMDIAAPKRPHVPLEFTTRENALKHLDEAATKCRQSLVNASDDTLKPSGRSATATRLSPTDRALKPTARCSSITSSTTPRSSASTFASTTSPYPPSTAPPPMNSGPRSKQRADSHKPGGPSFVISSQRMGY